MTLDRRPEAALDRAGNPWIEQRRGYVVDVDDAAAAIDDSKHALHASWARPVEVSGSFRTGPIFNQDDLKDEVV